MTIDNSECLIRFEGHGIRFDYPGFWELNEERDGSDVVITVTADGTCFWVLRILADNPRADDVVNSCVEALEEEYDEAEVESVTTTLAQLPANCREVAFTCFELLNFVSLTSVQVSGMTLLVWWQGTDHELGELRPLFEQLTQSVRIAATPDNSGRAE